MASAPRRPRLDSYGKPLPELADAREAMTAQDATNQAKRAMLHALVEDCCLTIMRRGWYGHVRIRFSVHDGIVAPDIYGLVERNWRNRQEP